MNLNQRFYIRDCDRVQRRKSLLGAIIAAVKFAVEKIFD